jgi:hypothetical protein
MKELLKDLGLTPDQLTKVEEAHAGKIKDNFIPLSRFNEVNEKAKTFETSVKDRDTQLAELSKKATGNDELMAQIAKLQEENKTTAETYSKQLQETKLNTALKLALTGKVKDLDIVSSLIDKSKIELDDTGNIKTGFNEQFENLQKTKDFLFISEDKKEFKGSTPKGVKDSAKTQEKDAFLKGFLNS